MDNNSEDYSDFEDFVEHLDRVQSSLNNNELLNNAVSEIVLKKKNRIMKMIQDNWQADSRTEFEGLKLLQMMRLGEPMLEKIREIYAECNSDNDLYYDKDINKYMGIFEATIALCDGIVQMIINKYPHLGGKITFQDD